MKTEKQIELGAAACNASEAESEYSRILSDRRIEGHPPNGGELRKMARLRRETDEAEAAAIAELEKG